MYWRIILNIVLIFIASLSFLFAGYLIAKSNHVDEERGALFLRGIFTAVFALWLVLMAMADKTNVSFSWIIKPTIIIAVVLGIILIWVLCKVWFSYQDYMYTIVPMACIQEIWFGPGYEPYEHDFFKITPCGKGFFPFYRYHYNVYCRSSEKQFDHFETQVLYGLTPVKSELNSATVKAEGKKYKAIKECFEKQNIKILRSRLDPGLHNCKFIIELNGQRYTLYSQDKFEKDSKNVAIWDHFPWEEAKKIPGFELTYTDVFLNASGQSE